MKLKESNQKILSVVYFNSAILILQNKMQFYMCVYDAQLVLNKKNSPSAHQQWYKSKIYKYVSLNYFWTLML